MAECNMAELRRMMERAGLPPPERIEAALALADADEFHYRNKDNKFAHDAHMAALEAYRATAPKPLRTPAEVNAEIAAVVRGCARRDGLLVDGELLGEARRLCLLVREPTAEAAPRSRGKCNKCRREISFQEGVRWRDGAITCRQCEPR